MPTTIASPLREDCFAYANHCSFTPLPQELHGTHNDCNSSATLCHLDTLCLVSVCHPHTDNFCCLSLVLPEVVKVVSKSKYAVSVSLQSSLVWPLVSITTECYLPMWWHPVFFHRIPALLRAQDGPALGMNLLHAVAKAVLHSSPASVTTEAGTRAASRGCADALRSCTLPWGTGLSSWLWC